MFRPISAASSRIIRRASTATTTKRAAVRAFSSATTSSNEKLNYGVIPKENFGDYKEYSVIHTNRSLNLMSDPFQQIMRNLNDLLCATYNAEKCAIIPGYVFFWCFCSFCWVFLDGNA